MHFQIKRVISSAISDRDIPEIPNVMSKQISGRRDSESNTFGFNQGSSENTNALRNKQTKTLCLSLISETLET